MDTHVCDEEKTPEETSEAPGAHWKRAANSHIGNRIRARRKHLRMSQTKLGELVGLTFQQVQKYEHGSNRISAAHMLFFASVLNVHPMYFLSGFEELPTAWIEEQPIMTAAHLSDVVQDQADLTRSVNQLNRSLARYARPFGFDLYQMIKSAEQPDTAIVTHVECDNAIVLQPEHA